jgi:hypothetical protein
MGGEELPLLAVPKKKKKEGSPLGAVETATDTSLKPQDIEKDKINSAIAVVLAAVEETNKAIEPPKRKKNNKKKPASCSSESATVKVPASPPAEPPKRRRFIAPSSQRILEISISLWFAALTLWIFLHASGLQKHMFQHLRSTTDTLLS